MHFRQKCSTFVPKSESKMELKVIAYARNGHTDKFGIPRQSREESPIETRIVFEPEYSVKEALRGIEGFSHLWLVWGFDKVESQESRVKSLDWSPTVRPPRLGGNTRMGVFATRSPFRPNPLGLSSVKLVRIVERGESRDKRLELIVTGADLLDGTPIYDIKPYLSFSDSHPEAQNGFADETKDYRLKVDWGESKEGVVPLIGVAHRTIPGEYQVPTRLTPSEWKVDVEYILSQDPRPAYQDDPTREYKLDYAGITVTFTVKEGTAFVQKIEKI